MIDQSLLAKITPNIHYIYWKTEDPLSSRYFDTFKYLSNGMLKEDIQIPATIYTKSFDKDLIIKISNDLKNESIESNQALVLNDIN